MSVHESAKVAPSKMANKQDTEFPGYRLSVRWSRKAGDVALGPFQLPEAAIRWSIRILAIVIAVAFWHVLTEYDFNYIMNFENVPEPAAVLVSFIQHIQTSEFFIHIAVSIKRILIGYGFATVFGILIGLLMGRSKLAEDFFVSYIEVLRPIPAVAWIPLAILMWPTEESSIIFITFLGALFPIVLNTALGAEQTPAVLVRAAQSLGASRFKIFWHVVIPSALPSIAAGLAIGMGVSWFSCSPEKSSAVNTASDTLPGTLIR